MRQLAPLAACIAAAWLAPTLVAAGSAGAAPKAPATGSVLVELTNVDSSDGQLLAALFRNARNFPGGGDKAFGKAVQKARAGTMRLRFEHVPPGPFAVTVHHDEDGDFEFDTGLFGIPTEGYGFSRNAHAPFGPPDFEDCRLLMRPGQRHQLKIRLRY